MNSQINKNSGIVYLVGAGPGDIALITVRGWKLISEADIIIYDFLANDQLLSHADANAELVYVGKQAGKHSVGQDKINEMLVKYAKAGKSVVRLKGGDPFIFGRGGEEALELAKAGIPFEIVPGVTSGAAVPAYCGIPVTHRNIATSVSFVTGHEDPTKSESQINWQALANTGGTLVFYMGVKNLPLIIEQLTSYGMDRQTPVAVIENGTRNEQRSVISTMANAVADTQKADIKPPAIIVIGNTVELSKQLNWFNNRPLSGKNIAITRAQAQASQLREKLENLGAAVIEFPTIKIEPPVNSEPLETAIVDINEYDWIIFTSVNGVEAFFNQLFDLGLDIRRVGGQNFCAIGPATAAKLREYGIVADLIPEKFIAESIADAFLARGGVAGLNILMPRADIARPVLKELFEAMDATVSDIKAYRTVSATENTDKLCELLSKDKIDYITFTSSSTVRNFFDAIPADKISKTKTKLVSIGPVTSKTITEYDCTPDIEAVEYTIDGLIDAILNSI